MSNPNSNHSNKRITPQGYVYGLPPFSQHPFWEDEKDVSNITASASVSNTTGTPSVEVENTIDLQEGEINFDFAFSGLKGERGEQEE